MMADSSKGELQVQEAVPALERESKADEFDEHDALVAGEARLPRRVA